MMTIIVYWFPLISGHRAVYVGVHMPLKPRHHHRHHRHKHHKHRKNGLEESDSNQDFGPSSETPLLKEEKPGMVSARRRSDSNGYTNALLQTMRNWIMSAATCTLLKPYTSKSPLRKKVCTSFIRCCSPNVIGATCNYPLLRLFNAFTQEAVHRPHGTRMCSIWHLSNRPRWEFCFSAVKLIIFF